MLSSDYCKTISKLRIERTLYEFSSEPFFGLFDAAMNGMIPHRFHVISSEPGSGKSKGIQKYLREYLDGGRGGVDTGIIIFLTRLDEIKSYIKGARLLRDDYAVLISGDRRGILKEYGGSSNPNEAPILFTTAQRFEARCGSSFEDSTDLFYRSKPRALRIWDEEFTPAKPSTITLDRIKELPALLRGSFNDLVLEVEKLEASMNAAVAGDEIVIPIAMVPDAVRAMADTGLGPKDSRRKTLGALIELAGKPTRVMVPRGSSRSIIGEVSRFPLDLAPLFILDASARVSGAYEIMERDGLPVTRYPAVGLSYRPATFHHLLTGAGKMTMKNKGKRKVVLHEAAEIINRDKDRWLIIYSRNDGIDLEKELKDLCFDPSRLEFVYWGNHRASNDYRDCKKVIVLGLMRYPEDGYEGKRLSYRANPKMRGVDIDNIRVGEIRSTMLQAITRSNIRNHDAGSCGACEVFLVDSCKDLRDHIKAAFPEAGYNELPPSVVKLGGRQQDILDHVASLPAIDLRRGIARKAIYDALGIERGNFGKLVRCPKFQKAAAELGVAVERSKFVLL
ncbi:hypothetical protein [Sphingomonas mucosissima]|uniref:Uncharacterized protein n=1 Tax=Sphingomonas mucosissima TaxID=370959 RepID=A0A245ZFS6_9SPHN|nr:hypothetical protein [Sphingomonas mucosissima]OWK28601.1 hypothetical protein SPMU_28630 [Sphingomonas mucosissima]